MVEETPSFTRHRLIRALVLSAFCFLIVRLVKAHTLKYYIAPHMEPYVKFAALGLFVIAVFQLYAIIRSVGAEQAQEDCDCGHQHAPSRLLLRSGFLYGLFALPLVLGFGLPDAVLGSSLASVKGIQLSAMAQSAPRAEPSSETATQAAAPKTEGAPLTEQQIRDLFPSDAFTRDIAELGMKLYLKDTIAIKDEGFMEMLTTVDMYRDNFVGKRMQLSGFVYREDGMADNQFIIGRLAMQCCTADALPYGVLVEGSGLNGYSNDEWITLTGTIGTTTYAGRAVLKLDEPDIRKIQAPDTPYVYPYFDDLSVFAE